MHKALSWDDARIRLQVVRHGTQGAASKALGVDQATLSGRLLRREEVIGAPLFLRDGTRLIPTDLARRMAEQAESAESALASAFAMEAEGKPEGVVRITATPMITAHVLAPALRLLRDLAPGIVVELIGAPENLGLTHREADVALRLTRPAGGSFLARRIAMVEYGVFARRGTDPGKLPWIGLDEMLGDLPEARWLAQREHEPVVARAGDISASPAASRSRWAGSRRWRAMRSRRCRRDGIKNQKSEIRKAHCSLKREHRREFSLRCRNRVAVFIRERQFGGKIFVLLPIQNAPSRIAAMKRNTANTASTLSFRARSTTAHLLRS